MKAKPVRQMFIDLGLTQEFARPRTPNDNPFIESLFSTVKTAPEYPGWFPGDLNGTSRYKRVEKRWWACENIYTLLEGYLERKADPPALGIAPNTTRYDTAGNPYNPMEKLGEAIEDLKNRGHILIPSERDAKGERIYDVKWMTDDQRVQLFIAAIQLYETMKIRGILVPERTVTQDQGTGSYGMSETHADIFMIMEETILGDIIDVLNEELLDQLVTANWGASAPRATLTSTGLSKEAQAIVKQIFTGLASSAPQVFSAIIDLVDLCEGYDIPLVGDARAILDRLQKQASMGVQAPLSPGAPGRFPWQNASLKDPARGASGDAADDVHEAASREAAELFEKLKARIASGVREGARDPFHS